MKNFEETLTYLCEKYNEVSDRVCYLQFEAMEELRLKKLELERLRLKIETWKPKN